MIDFPFVKQLRYAVSTVADGNQSFPYGTAEDVAENRKIFLTRNGFNPARTVALSLYSNRTILQVGNTQVRHGALDPGSAARADALITSESNISLFLTTADCLPLILFEPGRGVLALAHVGREDADSNFPQKIIGELTSKRAVSPAALQVAIGPGIHKESYRLPPTIQSWGSAWEPFLDRSGADGLIGVDLVGFTIAQLRQAGIAPDRIWVDPRDTVTDRSLFSHYRSVLDHSPEARFATVVGWNK